MPSSFGGDAREPLKLGALRVRLLAVVALALTPLLALSAVQVFVGYREEKVSRRDSLAASAHRAVDRVDSVIEGARPLLEALVGQEGIAAGGETCRRMLRNALLGMTEYNNVKRLDVDGDVACSALDVEGSVNEVSHGGSWFDALRGGSEFAVSEVFFSVISQGDVVLAAVPLYGPSGTFDGALALSIDVEQLNRFIDPRSLPNGAAIALVDESGDVISGLRDFPLDRIPSALIDAAIEDDDAMFLTEDVEHPGNEILVAPIVGRDIFVVLTTPNPSLLSWASVDLIGTVLLPLAMWLIALAAVSLASDRLVLQWLEYLGRIARLYGAGRFDVEPVRAAAAPHEVAELAETLRDMAENLKAREQELMESAEQKAALVKEVHHRVKNNLQIIVSLFNIQIANAREPATIGALEEARARINALALVHRSLYEAEDLRLVSLKPFFSELLQQLSDASGASRRNIVVETSVDDATLSSDEAVPLALFVTETVTNAFKHAFGDRSDGRLRVSIRRLDDDRLQLDVEDDGVGLNGSQPSPSGVGSALMAGFARQLGAEPERGESALGGARMSLVFAPSSMGVNSPPAGNSAS